MERVDRTIFEEQSKKVEVRSVPIYRLKPSTPQRLMKAPTCEEPCKPLLSETLASSGNEYEMLMSIIWGGRGHINVIKGTYRTGEIGQKQGQVSDDYPKMRES